MKAMLVVTCVVWAVSFGLPPGACAQESEGPIPPPEPRYDVRVERSVMVPMRDGVRLSTDLYYPVGGGDELPVILLRTPYNKQRFYRRVWAGAYEFAGQGYLVAVQDTRGRFESEGEFTISTPDVEDGYDATQWAATQPWSNGKVGTYGCSYLGDVQVMQAKARNPHLAAMIPQAAGSSIPHRGFGGVNGGAIEMAAGVGWFRANGSKVFLRPPPGTSRDVVIRAGEAFTLGPTLPEIDYREIWESLPLIDMLEKSGAPPSDWETVVSNRPASQWWLDRGYLVETDRFDTPSLQVNSWFDFGVGETLYQFNLMRRKAVSARARDNQFIIISPTTHCRSETATSETVVGALNVGDARFDLWSLYVHWFDYWLRGIENGVTEMPKVQIYVMGRNEWRGENEWPLARTNFTKYYLHSDGHANSRFGTGALRTAKPGDGPPDRYVYDPKTPVPSVGGPVCCTGTPDAAAGAFDQSEVETRHDVLVYTTPVFEQGVEVTGPIEAVFYVSSSARDTDFTAKLVDVYPDGTAYNVQEGILRARYREGWDKWVWMEEGGVYEVRISLHATSNYFRPGHRIRLEVSSSNFPRFDRNLNTGGNNYDETEWVVAENVIHHSSRYPSHLLLPVIP